MSHPPTHPSSQIDPALLEHYKSIHLFEDWIFGTLCKIYIEKENTVLDVRFIIIAFFFFFFSCFSHSVFLFTFCCFFRISAHTPILYVLLSYVFLILYYKIAILKKFMHGSSPHHGKFAKLQIREYIGFETFQEYITQAEQKLKVNNR